MAKNDYYRFVVKVTHEEMNALRAITRSLGYLSSKLEFSRKRIQCI